MILGVVLHFFFFTFSLAEGNGGMDVSFLRNLFLPITFSKFQELKLFLLVGYDVESN
jgi:hypothetical protein